MVAQGASLGEAIRGVGVAEVTHHRWRNEFGGLRLDQVRRLKELEQENTRLRRAVSDLTLDKLILRGRPRGQPKVRASGTDQPLAPPREGGPGLRGAGPSPSAGRAAPWASRARPGVGGPGQRTTRPG